MAKPQADLTVLQKILGNFTRITGIASVAVDSDGYALTPNYGFCDYCTLIRSSEEGLRRCNACDINNNGLYLCHAGLYDGGTQLDVQNTCLANVKYGQFALGPLDESFVRDLARQIGVAEDELVEASRNVKMRDIDALGSSIELLNAVMDACADSIFIETVKDAKRRADAEHIRQMDQEQRRYRSIFEILDIAYWEWSRTGGYFHSEGYNRYAIAQVENGEIWNQAIYADYVHPDDRSDIETFMACRDDGPLHRSTIVRAKMLDGSYRWTEMHAILEYGEDGKLARLVSIMRDVDGEWLRQKHQLEDALKQAKDANRDKSEFFARISHDMRTPLNGIIGSTLLALDEQDCPPRVNEYLHDIHFSGDFLLNLINDILDLSKIENNALELHPGRFSYAEFIDNMTKMIRPLCEKKHIALDMHPLDCDATVLVDSLRFQQIFFNIFSNAVKYTPEGGRIDHIGQITRVDERHIDCVGRIVDSGIGMSPEFQRHVFEPYSREHSDSEMRGTGLGLCIANQIAHLMGGELTIKSELGKGTEVTIHVLLETVPDQAADAACDSGTAAVDLEVLSGAHVLLCEDNALNAKIATNMLAKHGVTVDVAENGQEGFDLFAASAPGSFDCVLMDIRMPVMGGLAATRAMRSLERPDAATVPIVALSANAYESDIAESLAAGMNAHLAKPIEPDELYATLAQLIGARA